MKGFSMDGRDAADGLLQLYAALERASFEMLAAAREGDWDTVCRLEGACAVVIARLRRVGSERALPQAQQPERMRILKQILANDAEIRRLCAGGEVLEAPSFHEPPPTLH